MACSVFNLLTLPSTSNAFSDLRPSVIDRSGSPPRKSARLDNDGDSPSRHRERHRAKGPIRVQILGKQAVPTPSLDTKQALTTLRHTIHILLSPAVPIPILPLSYQGIYTTCRALVCVAHHGEDLYTHMRLEVEKCVSGLVKDLKWEKKLEMGKETLGYVGEFVRVCAWFEGQVELLRSLLSYLDQLYVLKTPDVLPIRKLCYDKFASVFLNPRISELLVSDVRDWVKWERDNRRPHKKRAVIPALISHLHTHTQYQQLFEDPYLLHTKSYYDDESLLLVQKSDDGSVFQLAMSQRVQEEVQRAKDVLPEASWELVRTAVMEAWLGDRLEWLAKAAVPTWMERRDVDKLAEMYSLFVQLRGTKILCAAFKAQVELTVRKIVADPVLDDDMVPRLLDFRSYVNRAISDAFTDPEPATSAPKPNQSFIYASHDAFTLGFSSRPSKPAELLAKHLDRSMRQGQQDLTDAEFEARLDQVLQLYRYTGDKDVFRTWYVKGLAKRLLLGRSASDDIEKAVLKKLKEQFDPEFGMGDQMFTDLALSRDKMLEYHEKNADREEALKLNVMVLQRSVWPFAMRKKGIDLPPNMALELAHFAEFYKTKHQGHQLYWDHALGTATLRAHFDAGPKDLLVSLYQAVILLLFNHFPSLSYTEILAQTNMTIGAGKMGDGELEADEAELVRTLQSLACGKKKVLKKHPVGRDVGRRDVFRFNPEFTDPRAKVHINSIQAKETPEETKRVQVSIEGDRRHYLDAAIVRIMKARKEMSNEDLKVAVVEAVKNHFKPDVKTIKTRIEALVEQEYLRRDEDDPGVFVYVA